MPLAKLHVLEDSTRKGASPRVPSAVQDGLVSTESQAEYAHHA